MMNRSVVGSGPMAGQPGALENVKYMTSREFQQTGARLPTAGQDIGNRNKVPVLVFTCPINLVGPMSIGQRREHPCGTSSSLLQCRAIVFFVPWD
jgi:hypothetical protein